MHAYARFLERYKQERRTDQQHLHLYDDSFFIPAAHNDNPDIYRYNPEPTGIKFHHDNSDVRLIIGPYGSGKSTICISEIIFRACQVPAWSNGVRKSKWAIIRNTYGELESTTYQTWMRWFGELGEVKRNKKPILTMNHRFNDGKGMVELDLIFLALDREDDLGKVRSLEVTGVYFNELSEIPKGAFDHFKGRIGRYPSTSACLEPYWSGMIADTNPPSQKHWIYDVFEKEQPDGHVVFHQPPGLIRNDKKEWETNQKAENISRLGQIYYPRLATGQSEEFIKVFCLGEYGTVLSGKKVYSEYNDDLHSTQGIEFEDSPVYIGLDFGITPAAVFVQENAFGQMVVVAEITSKDTGIRQFIEEALTPFINTQMRGIEIGAIVGDPAGEKRSETDLTSCFDIMLENRYNIVPAPSNLITPRLEAVKYFMNKLVGGKPLFLLNRDCETLREGFLGGYRYKKVNISSEERYYDKPDKNEYSHIQDALQYVLLYFRQHGKEDNGSLRAEDLINRSASF